MSSRILHTTQFVQRRLAAAASACLVLGIAPEMVSAQAQLLADINTSAPSGSRGSTPCDFVSFGNQVLFGTTESARGNRIWATDGTAAGTRPIFGLTHPELFQFQLSFAGRLGNSLLFRGFTVSGGSQLWRTDGTTTGTAAIPKAGLTNPNHFATLGAYVYFAGETVTEGIELWRTDGTAAGTTLVLDILPGIGSSRPGFLQPLGNKLIFTAQSELWTTDGTTAGTTLLKDIQPGPQGSYPQQSVVFGGRALFAARGSAGTELWTTDGTSAGTTQLKDLQPGSGHGSPEEITAAAGFTFFSADDGTHGRELWRTDGTSAGTQMVVDLTTGSVGSEPEHITAFGGGVLFRAGSPKTLWISLGTAGTTFELSASALDASAFTPTPANPGVALFRARSAGGLELWRTDGSVAGTFQVRNIHPSGSALSTRPLFFFGGLGNRAVFAADDGVHGEEPWITDGTTAGTTLLRDVEFVPASSQPRPMTPVDGKFLFTADEGSQQRLWVSDGTSQGTTPTTNPTSTFAGTMLGTPLSFGRARYFVGTQNGRTELWRIVGTDTQLVAPIGNLSTTPTTPVQSNGKLYFFNADTLWESDGTTIGTQTVLTLPASPRPAVASELTVFRSELWFLAEQNQQTEIWHSDGTASGTRVFSVTGIHKAELTVGNGFLFFVNSTNSHGTELWATTGTSNGTFQVRDILPGTSSSFPTKLTSIGTHIFFVAGPDRELWTSRGTFGTTVRVANINPFQNSDPDGLTPFGDRILFHADDGATGREPWVSDGTSLGTYRLADLEPGSGDSMRIGSATSFTPVGSGRIAMFCASTSNAGREPWRTDGTRTGTFLAADIYPGPPGSDPHSFAMAGNTVIFSANDGIHGVEPFGIPLVDLQDSLAATMGFGCGGTGGITPVLAPRGLPVVGNSAFALDLGRTLPQTSALLRVGLSPNRFDFSPTCATLIPNPILLLGLATSPTGTASLGIPIPNQTSLRGFTSTWEILVLDPRGQLLNVASASNALLLVVGD